MIYLLRHGLDDERYIGGWSDGNLTDIGIKQINEVGQYLKDKNYQISKIYTSDIKRAVESAEIINKYLNVEIICSEELRELNKGLLTGLEVNLAKRLYPKYFDNLTIYTKYPNGESLKDLYERINLLLNDNIFKDNNTLVVTHRGVINMIYAILNNEKIDTNKRKYGVEHASLHEYDLDKKLIKKIR